MGHREDGGLMISGRVEYHQQLIRGVGKERRFSSSPHRQPHIGTQNSKEGSDKEGISLCCPLPNSMPPLCISSPKAFEFISMNLGRGIFLSVFAASCPPGVFGAGGALVLEELRAGRHQSRAWDPGSLHDAAENCLCVLHFNELWLHGFKGTRSRWAPKLKGRD